MIVDEAATDSQALHTGSLSTQAYLKKVVS
jgi:hypothetical protein